MGIRQIPLDINEGMVGRFRERDPLTKEIIADRPLDQLTEAASHMQGAATRLHDLAAAIVGDHSFAGHAGRVKFPETATKVFAEADKRMTEAMKAAFAEIGRVQNSIRPAAPVNHLASEVRARLSQMKPDHRRQVLADADDMTIGALAHGPHWLSGVTKEEAELHVRGWTERKYPDESARLRRIGQALSAAQRINVSFKGYVELVAKDLATPQVASAKRVHAAHVAQRAAHPSIDVVRGYPQSSALRHRAGAPVKWFAGAPAHGSKPPRGPCSSP